MLFLTDSFRVDMVPQKETQIRLIPIYPENVKIVVRDSSNFVSCFRKDSVARKFVDETGLDATVNKSWINLSHGDKVVSVTENEEGDLSYWWIDLLQIEEC